MKKSFSISFGFLLISLFLISSTFAQSVQKQFKNEEINCSYSLKNGMLDGVYQSFYKNEKIKVNGVFVNNNRVGLWTIYDITGNIILKRVYKSNFEYKQLYPLNTNNYTFLNKRDSNNIIKDFYVKEPMVITSNRICRLISKENNELLFEDNLLEKSIINMVLDSSTIAYNPKNDEFTKAYSLQEFKDKFDFSKIEIIAFKIKEDWFIDSVRKISETRILGICPVGRYKNDTTKKMDLFWLYYPDIRPYLAKVKISIPKTPFKNLEDLFYFRYFVSSIYKGTNVYDKEIKDYKKGKEIELEADRIFFQNIETEHDYWIDLLKK